jgi:formylglycine-generating enzyme required for sulfatase activity
MRALRCSPSVVRDPLVDRRLLKGSSMRLCILISTLGVLAASVQLPVLADPFPDETPAVVLNRNLEMVAVKGGCYRMGSDAADSARDEKPVHDACVKDFLLGTYEVTQVQWISVMGKNPSSHVDCGEACPV